MSLLTIAWSFSASVCLMLGSIHLLFWFRNRSLHAYLLSSLMAFSAGVSAMLELGMLHTESLETYRVLILWENVALFMILVPMVWFIQAYFGTGLLTLIGVDSVANYQQVLRTVSYDNVAGSPDTSARFVQFTATDGITPSNTATTTVTIGANEAPVVTPSGLRREPNSCAHGGDECSPTPGNATRPENGLRRRTLHRGHMG